MKFEVLDKKRFEDVGIRIIQVEGDDRTFWLSGEEIGTALELTDPKKAIFKIFERHKDELEEFSMLWPIETAGGTQDVRIFSEEGTYLITFFSQSPKAKEFRKWVAKLLKAYRQGKLGIGAAARERLARMKEHRLFMEENRKFQAAARAEAERIIRDEGTIEALDSVPVLQEAVKAIVEKDPRIKNKQLSLI
ncbi:BRO family, N-terminal domain protein [delta proteobacterium NaphS2]|nr:BRO family, N-terminal domain protein [delta proteobacterium NaphS2]